MGAQTHAGRRGIDPCRRATPHWVGVGQALAVDPRAEGAGVEVWRSRTKAYQEHSGQDSSQFLARGGAAGCEPVAVRALRRTWTELLALWTAPYARALECLLAARECGPLARTRSRAHGWTFACPREQSCATSGPSCQPATGRLAPVRAELVRVLFFEHASRLAARRAAHRVQWALPLWSNCRRDGNAGSTCWNPLCGGLQWIAFGLPGCQSGRMCPFLCLWDLSVRGALHDHPPALLFRRLLEQAGRGCCYGGLVWFVMCGGAWGVGRGAWGVGRGAWGVGRGAWGVGRGTWGVL